MSYYPLTALAWLLGAVNAACYLLLGAEGVQVPQQVWLMLYVDAALFQVGLYLWNRRHNVSPHEEAGSSGLPGCWCPRCARRCTSTSWSGAVLRRTAGFVVTPKGDSDQPGPARYLRTAACAGPAFYAALLVSVAAAPRPRVHAGLGAAGPADLPDAVLIWWATLLHQPSAPADRPPSRPRHVHGGVRVPAAPHEPDLDAELEADLEALAYESTR